MKKFRLTILSISILSLFGCTSDLGRFTNISTSNANLKEVEHSKYVRAKGKSSYTGFLLIPFGELKPNIHKATYDALKNSNGDILTDAQAEEFFWGLYPIIWTKGVSIEGKAHNTRGLTLRPIKE